MDTRHSFFWPGYQVAGVPEGREGSQPGVHGVGLEIESLGCGGDPLFQKATLELAARDRERRLEVLRRRGAISFTQLELAECGAVERVLCEALAVVDRPQRLEPPLDSVALGHRDRPI